jgi:hypothetical protein
MEMPATGWEHIALLNPPERESEDTTLLKSAAFLGGRHQETPDRRCEWRGRELWNFARRLWLRQEFNGRKTTASDPKRTWNVAKLACPKKQGKRSDEFLAA